MSSAFTQTRTDAEAGPPLIGALLRMPVDVVRRHMLDSLHAHGFTDLNEAHFQVLRWPGPNGQRPVELADQAGMSRQAMNYLLGQLEALGYVERRVDPDDVRSRCVYLTERGTATVGVIRAAVTELERQWETRLGPAGFKQLKQLLVELNEAVSRENR
jgi:DNA-binding MarR family transcriptional regulator